MAATPQRKRKKKRKKATQFAIFTEQKKEVFTNKFALTHAYDPLTPLLNSHLQLHIQFSHTISSVTQQHPNGVKHNCLSLNYKNCSAAGELAAELNILRRLRASPAETLSVMHLKCISFKLYCNCNYICLPSWLGKETANAKAIFGF